MLLEMRSVVAPATAEFEDSFEGRGEFAHEFEIKLCFFGILRGR
jgi:hypothetical protein